MAFPHSQVPSLVLDHQVAALPLEKFSFTVSTLGTAKQQWAHDNRADELFLVFRQTRQSHCGDVTNNPLMMSITAGSQILESEDLKKLKAMVVDYELHGQQGHAGRLLDSPVHVMIKFPCIALRYLISVTLQRRIQMRFKNEADYQRAVSIFEELRFPIHNAMKTDSPGASMRPLRPTSATVIRNPAGFDFRDQPGTSVAPKNYEIRASSTVNDICYTLPRPLLTEESPFFRRSHTASSDTAQPGSVWSLDGSKASDTVSPMSFGEPLVRPSSVFNKVRPISASQLEGTIRQSSSYNTDFEREHVSQPHVLDYEDRNLIFTRNKAPPEAFGSLLPSSTAMPSQRLFSGSQYEYGPVRRATSSQKDTTVEGAKLDKQMNGRISLVPQFLRPLSAPVSSTPENVTWLPPRRELPFPKARPSMKSSTPVAELPSYPEAPLKAVERQLDKDSECVAPGNITLALPRTIKRVAQRQTNRAPLTAQRNVSDAIDDCVQKVDGRDGTLQTLAEREEEPSPLATKSAALSRPSTAPGLRSKVMTTATRKRGRDTGPDNMLVNKQARTMIDKATQTQTGSGRDHTAPLILATDSGQSLSSTNDASIQPPESFMSDIEAFVSRHKHRPAPKELWQRPGYSEALPEERQRVINDFICENLDNEDFLKLCEDTGNVWRRIGLEM